MRDRFFSMSERAALYDHLCDEHDWPSAIGSREHGPDDELVGWHARYHGMEVLPGHAFFPAVVHAFMDGDAEGKPYPTLVPDFMRNPGEPKGAQT